MDALEQNALNIGETLRINERFGGLLRQERAIAGRSIRTIARKFKVRCSDLRRWELGLSSPPANKFYAIIHYYGNAAIHRATSLDFQIQMEKYQLYLASKENDPARFAKPPVLQYQNLVA